MTDVDVQDQLQKLRQLPEGPHWFCPRQGNDDTETYDDDQSHDDTVNEDRKSSTETKRRIVEAYDRKQLVFACLQLFAYDGPDAIEQQEWLKSVIDIQLGRCDACIGNYHKGKKAMLDKLRTNHGEEQVADFQRILDEKDIERLKRGLESAAHTLKRLPPQKRDLVALDAVDMLAIFETLSCQAFLQDDGLLCAYFDEPFKLVQTKKRLRLQNYVPAMTWFLFDATVDRSSWAMQSWSKAKHDLTFKDFEWAVRDRLQQALKEVSTPGVDLEFVQRFWCGAKLIVEKLDRNLITHSLRDMDVDVCRLALEHLQFDTPGLRCILHTVRDLLEKAPDQFWDAMGAISPTTVVEQIFNSPHFVKFLLEADGNPSSESLLLQDMLSWISPLMASLKTAIQPPACRSLVSQLVDRLQSDRFPENARLYCMESGLGVILGTLRNFNKDSSSIGSVGRVVVSDTLEVVGSHIKTILGIARLPESDKRCVNPSNICIDITSNALWLECRALQADHEALEAGRTLQHGTSSYSPVIWNAVVQSLDSNNLDLAKSVLKAICALLGLEKFKIKSGQDQYKEKDQFNITYGQLTLIVSQIMERLSDMDPCHLDQLFKHKDAASALWASLFSADLNTYQSGLDVIKSVSGQSGRKEALHHMLFVFFATTMNCLSWSVRRIANKRTFASAPRMLKTCTDVLDILCSAGDGMLRGRTLNAEEGEVEYVVFYWQYQWQALTVIFDMTEAWSNQGHDKDAMMEFCRDTMEFADRLFERFSIFASAIDSVASKGVDADTAVWDKAAGGRRLLESPRLTMKSMVKWLRLRDVYLATTSRSLISKILHRLGEFRMIIDEKPLAFLKKVAEDSARTILTPQEKAELARALEEHQRLPIEVAILETNSSQASLASQVAKKQGTITAWTKSADGRRISPTPSFKAKPTSGVIDLEAWKSKALTLTPPIELSDDEFGDSDIPDEELIKASWPKDLSKAQPVSQPSRLNVASRFTPRVTQLKSAADVLSFKQKREQEKEAKRKRDALALEAARLRRQLPLKGVAQQTAEEGSGLNGLGVRGKDHAPKTSNMMVSSDSESDIDDEDDEIDRTLFGMDKPPKASAAFKAYQESKAKALKQVQIQGPVKKTKQVRSTKDMRARLAPDLSSLHKTILSWDFFLQGDFPSNSDQDDYSLVSNTFRTPLEYQKTFQPLLVLEAWQGFLKAKEEGNFKPFEIQIINRLTVDAFIEVTTTMLMSDAKDIGIGDADIILMSKAASPATEKDQAHCFARVRNIVRKKNIMEISYRVNTDNALIASMAPGINLHGIKVSSITPLEREYGALLGLQYYDLCDEIVRAKPSPLLKYTDKQLDGITATYKVNQAQAKAVRSAIDNDAFTLIQGPPGSGKTKTIVAIVGALLTSSLGDRGVAIARPSVNTGLNLPSRGAAPSKKLLVCAPSNAAVDELVMRFKQGIKTLTGEFHKISVVRLGRSDAVNTNVLDVTLEELVNARLNLASGKKTPPGEEMHQFMMEHKATSEETNLVRSKLDEARAKGETAIELQREFDLLRRKKSQLSTKIDNARDSGNTAARDAEISRRRVQQDVLDGANVICATLSGSGHDMFQSLSIEFETVVIDEAAQSIELSALIPLKYGCSKCILVGDPKQLPPTVLSREAARFQYEQSLFVRMQSNHPNDVHLLDTQYRMHPEISLFPSKAFYDGKLLDGNDMAGLRAKPWHASNLLGPYRFFDVQGQHQNAPRGHSLINIAELEVALQLFERLTTDYKGFDFKGKVGIITPYKSQLRELKLRFSHRYGESIFEKVEFNTTDAFQGRESEVIIFSCVRASSSRGIGFLADIRRMNVGLTRAKSSLWVLGNSESLIQGEFWENLIKDARERNRYTTGDLMTMLRKPTSKQNLDKAPGKVESHRAKVDVSRPSAGSFAVLDKDVEMKDASSSTSSSSTMQSPIDTPMEDIQSAETSMLAEKSRAQIAAAKLREVENRRAGGAWGLDDTKACPICGSLKHIAKNCDNTEALIASGNSCHRCGGLGHRQFHCKEIRCFKCGDLGHAPDICENAKLLPQWRQQELIDEKRQLRDREAEIKRYQDRFVEKTKKHIDDRGVPVVQNGPTAPSSNGVIGKAKPKPSQNTRDNGKRRREYSPPRDFPLDVAHDKRSIILPDSAKMSNSSAFATVNRQIIDDPQPVKSDTKTSPPSAPPYNAGVLRPGPNQVSRTGAIPQNMGQSAAAPSHGSQTGAPPQNMGRLPYPPKKKKEVDPFIRPKPKRPRK